MVSIRCYHRPLLSTPVSLPQSRDLVALSSRLVASWTRPQVSWPCVRAVPRAGPTAPDLRNYQVLSCCPPPGPRIRIDVFSPTSPPFRPVCRLRKCRRVAVVGRVARCVQNSHPCHEHGKSDKLRTASQTPTCPSVCRCVSVHCSAQFDPHRIAPSIQQPRARRPSVGHGSRGQSHFEGASGLAARVAQCSALLLMPFSSRCPLSPCCVCLTAQRYCSVCSVQLLSATRVSRNTLHKRCKFCSDARLRQPRPHGLKYREGCRSPVPPPELDDADSDVDVDTAPVSPAAPADPSPAHFPALTAL